MIVYLAGFKTIEKVYPSPTEDIYLLSSFFEHKGGKYGDYVKQDRHILDSGAFSTFKDIAAARSMDWDLYVRKYIAFIKATKQRLFFELDIDAVVGLPKVEQYRDQIAQATGIAPIPCWHSNRKWEGWLKMCEEYPYVAIGTTKATPDGVKMRKNPAILSQFIKAAHDKKAKVHGLGFTSVEWLHRLKFDSVDSTTWNVGGKYGNVCLFDGVKYSKQWRPKGMMVKDTNAINLFNFGEWVKFQRYAKDNL